jgi:hypothetical protein
MPTGIPASARAIPPSRVLDGERMQLLASYRTR